MGVAGGMRQLEIIESNGDRAGRRTLEGTERRSQNGGGEGGHVATGERDRSSGGSAGSVKPGDFEWGEVVGEGSYSLVRKVTRTTTSHILMGLESVLMPRVDAREFTMLATHAAARASITCLAFC